MKRLLFTCIFLSVINSIYGQFPIDLDSLKFLNKEDISKLNKGLFGFNVQKLQQVKMGTNPSEKTDAIIIPGCENQISVPTTKAQLTDGWKEYFYKMNLNSAANLGLVNIVQGESTSSLEVYVYDFMLLKDVQDCKGNDYRFGSGMRLIIRFKKLDANITISGLPSVAASAELNKAEVTVEMRTYGISGSKLNSIAPLSGEYDVRKHVEYMETLDKFKKEVINDASTVYTPKLISYSPNAVDYNAGVAQYYAFKFISKGKTYNYAISKVKNSNYHLEIEKVYKSQMNSNWQNQPSKIDRLTAKKTLSTLLIKTN